MSAADSEITFLEGKMNTGLTEERCVEIIPELAGLKIEITGIKGGITNTLYRVRASNDHDYVFRIYGMKTEMFIDRDAEMKTMKALEPFGVSPRVVRYLPEQNITVIDFINGYTLKNADFLKEDFWEHIIRPIKVVHRSGVEISKTFEPMNEIERMYGILQEINSNYPEFDISGTIQVLKKTNAKAGAEKIEIVLCHNDLLAENFLFTNNRGYPEPMYLIDWEYAGMNTYYYEIADMFQEILVPYDVETKLLEIYWEGKDLEFHQYMTDLFKPFPDIYWFLWSLIQQNVSTIQFDYYNYGKVKFENARKNIEFIKDRYGIAM
jgi:thiamine kinase-like enzyme